MKRSRQAVFVAAAIVVLAVAVVVLAQVNRSDADVAEGSIAVTRDGTTLTTFTMAEIQALPSVTAEKTIRSSSNADETGEFTGVPLADVLDAAGPELLGSASMVVTRATDGFVSALDPGELEKRKNVLLVYAKNGEPLGTEAEGGSGPFRIIILTDPFGNRCTRWVNEIEIR